MPRTSWKDAIRQTTEYRDYLKTLKVADELKTKAYLLTRESIEQLLSQDGLKLDGIRVYIGQDTVDGERLIRLVPIATQRIEENGVEVYNDYITNYVYNPTANRDGEGDGDDPPPPPPDPDNIGDERPCPEECSDPNPLTPGP